MDIHEELAKTLAEHGFSFKGWQEKDLKTFTWTFTDGTGAQHTVSPRPGREWARRVVFDGTVLFVTTARAA